MRAFGSNTVHRLTSCFLLFLASALTLSGCASGPEPIQLLAPPTPLAGEISGTVSTGRAPVNQATVSLSPTELTTVTNADGAYLLNGVAPGNYLVRGSAAGFAQASRDVTVLAGSRSGGDLTLARAADAGSIAGRVTDKQIGISGARLLLQGSGAVAVTAEDGSFLFSGIAAGLYTLQVSRAGFSTASVPVQVAAGQLAAVNITLPRRADGTLVGRLTDGTAGIASCGRPGVVVLFSGAVSTRRDVPLADDCARSRGVLAVDDRFRFEGLSTGPHLLQAAVNGFRTGTKLVQVLGGAENNGDIVLTLDGATAAVTGTVLDDTLLAISGVKVDLAAGATSATAQTGADGKFVFRGLTASGATLTASKLGFNATVLTVSLSAGNTADGTLVLRR